MENKYLSIIIPAYNEEERLAKSLKTILAYLKKQGYPYEIIVVDDGSTDRTVASVKELLKNNPGIRVLSNEGNRGKGYSVRRGMLEASGSNILFSDADLSTPIEELDKLFSALKDNSDIAIASRSMKNSEVVVHQPFYRELMGKLFNKLVKLFAVKGFIDTQCGFKLFTAGAAKTVFSRQKLNGFSFDVEILHLSQKNDLKVTEIPVRWFNSPQSKVSPVTSSMKMFIDLLKIKRMHRKDK